MASRGLAIVDGSNVAHIDRTKDGKPKIGSVVAVRDILKAMGFTPMVIVDATLYHEIDDPDRLDHLLNTDEFQQAPAGTDADYFVLSYADNKEAIVVSNDRFEDYREEYPWIDEKRVPLMIVNGDVQLYGPALEQQGKQGK